jgi:hypothetical protein
MSVTNEEVNPMRSRVFHSVAAVVVPALLISSCAPGREELQGLRRELSEVKAQQADARKVLDRVAILAANTPSPATYHLSDVARKSKAVATITSDIPIAKGDRIFLGDDMWDVKYVKIYTRPADASSDPPSFRSGNIEVLVTFGGKARDPESEK